MSEVNREIGFQRKTEDNRRQKSQRNDYEGARSVRSLGGASRSATSIAFSAISVVPDLDPVLLMSIAWEIYQLRQKLIAKAQQQKIGLREVLNSTKLQKLLQCVSYPIKIGNLKALLKELGFNWNGTCCSLT